MWEGHLCIPVHETIGRERTLGSFLSVYSITHKQGTVYVFCLRCDIIYLIIENEIVNPENMSNTRKLIFYTSFILSILTAGTIFFLTTQSAEATLELTDTVKSTAPVLFPEAADEGMFQQIWHQLQLNNPRRMAHIYQFGVFGVCVASACMTFGDRFLYRKGVLLRNLLALAICAAYSLLDQTHKLFVPGREFDTLDLILDAIGYVAGTFLVLGITVYCIREQK